ELLLPPATYHVALDGFTGEAEPYSLRGSYAPLAVGSGRAEAVTVDAREESGRLVDLLRARAVARCGGDEVRSFDLEVRAPGLPDGAVITASLSPLVPGDRGGDGEIVPRRVFDPTQPRVLWLPGAEGFSTDAPICGQNLREASNQAATAIPAGGARLLRIIAPASTREPDVQALVLRVQHPASPELKAACAEAKVLDLPPLGAYASDVGGDPSPLRTPERADVFAITECRAGGLFRPPVDLGLLGRDARAP